jgi:ChpA-C
MKAIKSAAVAVATVGLLAAGAGLASADTPVGGSATASPGVVSGNLIQVPVELPITACGNSIDVVGLLNPATGSLCMNG